MGKILDAFESLFCRHEYECIVSNQSVYKISVNSKQDTPAYHQWIYVCKKCGKRKKITDK